MPPKNKKQAEQQAKKLQQQRKKKEEEQERIQLQRKKYAGQSLDTGLFLPASNQLIIEFPDKKLQFITETLQQTLKQGYQNLNDPQFVHRTVIKELHYWIKDSREIFNINKLKNIQGKQTELLKARAFIGIMLKVMLNESPYLGGTGKTKDQDQKLFKRLLTTHAIDKKPQMIKIFSKQQTQRILQYASETYFSHYLLLQHCGSFQKRVDKREFQIHMTVPALYLNTRETKFTDLVPKEESSKEQHKNEVQIA